MTASAWLGPDAPAWVVPVAFGVLVFFLAALLQAAAGFGSALVSMPLLLHLLDPPDALFATCLSGVVLAAWGAVRDRAHISWPAVTRLSGAALVGIPAGIALLLLVDDVTIRILTAVVVLAAVAIEISGATWRPGRGGVLVCGVVSGSLLASSGVNGPPCVMALGALPPRSFRASLQGTFLLQDLAVVLALVLTGRAGALAVAVGASALLALPLGWRAGDWVFERLDRRSLRVLVATLLIATAVSLIHGSV